MFATITTPLTYTFHVNGEKGIYEVAFSVDDDSIKSACSCDYHSDRKMCWHRYYVLAGKTHRIPEAEFQVQGKMLEKLSKTHGGRDMIRHAKANFGEKELCRRCNSSQILDIKKSFLGRIISIFIPRGRRYFCWACRWSW
jgi:hypothetical protein